MTVLRVVKYLALAVVLIPIFIGAVGGMKAGKESARLQSFCGRFPSGTDMQQFRTAVTSEGYFLSDQTDQIAVIVVKPGIGYYACNVHHDGKALSRTEYIWND